MNRVAGVEIKISANRPVDGDATQQLLAALVDQTFLAPIFRWRALSVRMRTSGAQFGYGKEAYFYDVHGAWEPASFKPIGEQPEDLIYSWIEATYKTAGRWSDCLIQIVRGDEVATAKIEFEFDARRWKDPEGEGMFGDIFRPLSFPPR